MVTGKTVNRGGTDPCGAANRGRVLVVQNAETDPIGALARPLLVAGWTLDTRKAYADRDLPPLQGYAGLLVLGGAVNPDQDDDYPWLQVERNLLASALHQGVPILAVCLGAQLLGQASGGSARRMPLPRFGWTSQRPTGACAADPLGDAWLTLDRVLEWHAYTVTLPTDATLLAGSPADVQAFRVGASAWGFQYHLEADHDAVHNWLHAYRNEIDPEDAEAMRAFTRRRDYDITAHGIAIGQAFSTSMTQRRREASEHVTAPQN